MIVLFDATYSIDKMRERLLPGILWSPDALVSSWEHIEALEKEHGAVLLGDPRSQCRPGRGGRRGNGTNDVVSGHGRRRRRDACDRAPRRRVILGNFFIVDCGEETLFVDSGLGLASIATELPHHLQRPATLLLTHGHNDHRGGAREFEVRIAHRLEQGTLERRAHGRTRPSDWPPESLAAARAAGYTFPDYMLETEPRSGFDPTTTGSSRRRRLDSSTKETA